MERCRTTTACCREYRLYPSLTGLGDRRHLRQTGINLDTHTDDIVNLILDEDIAYTFILAGRFNGALFRPIYQRFQQEHIGDTFVVNSSHAAMLTAPKETAELLQHVR
ncbi:hypothetical protein [Gallibacterium salpingitidis]|uniref:hypothetical protein n=1 Tax=Gallibacterium salpingitidis TaxID=505341 RepID=UPI0012E92508|nr:hypothetical protein [Gallibacterium salpingitidis]